MGHKVSDGRSYVAVATGAVAAGDPVEYDGVFGFADTDAANTESFSMSIGQEEREVLYPGAAAAWAVGDPVFWTGTVFTQTALANRFVGRVTRGAPITTGGVGWMLVAPQAFATDIVGHA
jgi:hypothetical protein